MTIDAERGTIEKMLVFKLSNATKLPSERKRPSRDHLQRGVLLPLMASFHLSSMRNTSI